LFLDDSAVSSGFVPDPGPSAEDAVSRLPALRQALLDGLAGAKVPVASLRAVSGPGGLLRPLPGGVYKVNEAMLTDAGTARDRWGMSHPYDVTAPYAAAVAAAAGGGCRAFVVDPLSTDELPDVARLSGVPDVARPAVCEAAAVRATARFAASRRSKSLSDLSVVIAHLSDTFTVAAVSAGRIVDATWSLSGAGPFSPRSAGTLPFGAVLSLAESGSPSRSDLLKKLYEGAGLLGYTGSADLGAVSDRVRSGDLAARLALEAMAYQVAKEIGALSAALGGRIDAVALSGEGARSPYLVSWIQDRVRPLGPLILVPGDRDLSWLAPPVVAVLSGSEIAKEYAPAGA